MVINRQSKLRVDVGGARVFVSTLGREMKLGRRHFNVCLVDDDAIRELNASFRHKPYATDVLSFAWSEGENGASPQRVKGRARRKTSAQAEDREFDSFLGDVVISVETAERNARDEGHSTNAEIRWLILHGLLHLCGMDHETDHGEMESLELELRARLGPSGARSLGKRAHARRLVRPRRRRAASNGASGA